MVEWQGKKFVKDLAVLQAVLVLEASELVQDELEYVVVLEKDSVLLQDLAVLLEVLVLEDVEVEQDGLEFSEDQR